MPYSTGRRLLKVSDAIVLLQNLPQDAVLMDFNSGMEKPVEEIVYKPEEKTVWFC